jgi:predicted Na+-dependent transporter
LQLEVLLTNLAAKTPMLFMIHAAPTPVLCMVKIHAVATLAYATLRGRPFTYATKDNTTIKIERRACGSAASWF